ncbi:ATP-binding protein [Ekhidna sp.]|uniref:ATP-binding protein n=1 Tax=Ekhidna sp. TaxID=2608089 RepID=UPI003296C01F
MKKIGFLFLFLSFGISGLSQSVQIDSLEIVANSFEENDSAYVDAINELAFRLSQTNQQRSIHYINQAISISKEIEYERGLLRATMIKGNSFLIVGLPDQALSYYLEALTYNPTKYPLEEVRLHNNIGELYRRKGVFDSSLAYFNKALQLAITNVPEFKPVIILSNLGEVSLMKGAIDNARGYFQLCLKNALETDHLRGLGYGYYGLAECEYHSGNILEGIKLMRKSIAVREKSDHKRGLIQSYMKIGEYFKNDNVNDPDSVFHYWKKSEEIAKSQEANDLLNQVYNNLYALYLSRKEIDQAVLYLNRHKHLDDSIRNAEFISNVERMQVALQSDLIAAENRLLKQKQEQHASEEEARLIVILLAVIIVGGLGFSTYRYQRRQKTIAEAKAESRFTLTLLQLTKELNSPDLQLDVFIKDLLIKSRSSLKCDRATFWSFIKDSNEIRLHSLDTKSGAPIIPQEKFSIEEFPDFFEEFLKNRTVAVVQLSKDTRLTDIYEKYFKPSGIESILNAPVMIDGQFVGLLSYSMIHGKSREWKIDEERYVGSLTDLFIAAIAKHKSNILEVEKEELIKKLKSRNKSLKEFNSVISHNLREPLTQIIGFSELLRTEKELEISDDIIDRIGIASNKVDKVIKELSTVLNVSDPLPADFRNLSVEKLTKEVLDLLKSEIATQNITIEQDLKVGKIRSYKPFLSDALYHVLSNCLKFSDPSRRLHIKISSYEDELHQYITVTDNGRGMNLNKVSDKLFKMYQRFHMDVEGRGMGLFIVKSRVNALNGWVRIQSEEGIGSEVIFEFPNEEQTLTTND